MLFPRAWRHYVPLFLICTIIGLFFFIHDPLGPRHDSFHPEDTDQFVRYKPIAARSGGSHYHNEQQAASDALYNASNSVQRPGLQQSTLDKRVQPIPNDTPSLFQARCRGEAAVARMQAAGLAKHTTITIKDLENTSWLILDLGIQDRSDPLDGPFPNYRSGAHLYSVENFKDYKDSTGTLRVSRRQ